MFQNDYILREIENLARFLTKVLHSERDDTSGLFDEFGNVTETGLLSHRLRSLILESRVNEAENLLFEQFGRNPNRAYLDAAVKFYSELGKMTDKALERAEFSRQEIAEGLSEIKEMFLRHNPVDPDGDNIDIGDNVDMKGG